MWCTQVGKYYVAHSEKVEEPKTFINIAHVPELLAESLAEDALAARADTCDSSEEEKKQHKHKLSGTKTLRFIKRSRLRFSFHFRFEDAAI